MLRALDSRPLKRALLYGGVAGVLIALLNVIEYQHFVRTFPGEVYGGLIAIIFTGVGLYLGLKGYRPKEVVVVKEVEVRVPAPAPPPAPTSPPPGPFAVDRARLDEVGITPRELEVLTLIAEGLSNREIGERLFVSENTVKTHSSRLFEKLGVSRRVQAVQKGRELGLIA